MPYTDVMYALIYQIDVPLRLDILLQPPQPVLRLFQYIIRFADSESQPVFGEVGIFVSEKLCRWDCCYAELLDTEPRKLEVAGPASDVRWEGVVGRKLHLGEVDEDEVAAFGLGVLLEKMLVPSHEQG